MSFLMRPLEIETIKAPQVVHNRNTSTSRKPASVLLMPIGGLLPCGGLLYLLEPCYHKGEQRLHRLEPGRVPRDEVLNPPRNARGVQRCLGSKLHHKGMLDREGACGVVCGGTSLPPLGCAKIVACSDPTLVWP